MKRVVYTNEINLLKASRRGCRICLLTTAGLFSIFRSPKLPEENYIMIMVSLCMSITVAVLNNNPSVQTLDDLKQQVIQRINAIEGTFAVAFRDLAHPENFIFINEKDSFHAASTMKTPVMIEVFRQAEQGLFSLSDSIPVKNEFRSIVDGSTYSMDIDRDSGEGLYEFIGKKVTVRDLVVDMIALSGNLATNILIDLVDAKNVMETMRGIGAVDIRVLRGVEDMKAFERGLNNSTTAYDLLLIYEALGKHDIVSQEACRDMISILREQKHRTKIPAHLPRDVHVAHKTGSITGVQHDSGIVYLPDGRAYTLVVLSKNLKSGQEGINAIADISKMIYNWMIADTHK
jgi:beta-lactamase class A